MYKKHDKKKVLRMGLELFWSRGYNDLGVDEICKRTGMTKGAFYNAFESKQKFFLQTIKLYGDLTANHIRSRLAMDNRRSALHKLEALYVELLEDQQQLGYPGCMVCNTMSEMSPMNETIRQAALAEFEKLVSEIEPTVRQAQAEGDLEKNVAPRRLARLIHSSFFGMLTYGKTTKRYTEATEAIKLFFKSMTADHRSS